MGLKIAVGLDFVRMFAIQTRYFCYSSQGGCGDAFKSMSLKGGFPYSSEAGGADSRMF